MSESCNAIGPTTECPTDDWCPVHCCDEKRCYCEKGLFT